MPFGSAFATNNLGINMNQLTILYVVAGVFNMIIGPNIGKASDKLGKYPIFVLGSLLTIVTVLVYCNLGVTPLVYLIMINVVMFAGISARMISSSALLTSVPTMQDRGAFMSINSSVQQLAGGVGAFVAGLIVVQNSTGKIEHYNTLGYVVVCSSLITIGMMFLLNRMVQRIIASRAQAK